jgi:TRAP-type transport system small permease protein
MRIIAVIGVMARFMTLLSVVALIVMMASTSWDVVARATINRPLHGVVEIVEIMVMLVAFLGLPEVFLRDENVKVDLVDTILSARLLAWVRIVAMLLSLTFLGLLAWNLIPPMVDAYRFGDIKPDLMMPLYPLYAAVFVSILASVLTATLVIFQEFGGGTAR